MFICWNVGGLPMEVHLQSHCFYIKFAKVNELQQKSLQHCKYIVNITTQRNICIRNSKKTSIYYTLLVTQKCWEITYGKVIVNRLYHITLTTVYNSWKA